MNWDPILVFVWGGGGIGLAFVLPIHALLVAAIGVIVRSLHRLWTESAAGSRNIAALHGLLDAGHYEDAIELAEASPWLAVGIVRSALARVSAGTEAMRDAAERACAEMTATLLRGPQWLALIGQVAPLMGLFGTVTGMVMYWSQIAQTT